MRLRERGGVRPAGVGSVAGTGVVSVGRRPCWLEQVRWGGGGAAGSGAGGGECSAGVAVDVNGR